MAIQHGFVVMRYIDPKDRTKVKPISAPMQTEAGALEFAKLAKKQGMDVFVVKR